MDSKTAEIVASLTMEGHADKAQEIIEAVAKIDFAIGDVLEVKEDCSITYPFSYGKNGSGKATSIFQGGSRWKVVHFANTEGKPSLDLELVKGAQVETTYKSSRTNVNRPGLERRPSKDRSANLPTTFVKRNFTPVKQVDRGMLTANAEIVAAVEALVKRKNFALKVDEFVSNYIEEKTGFALEAQYFGGTPQRVGQFGFIVLESVKKMYPTQ